MTIKELENQISNLQTELEKLKQAEKEKNKEEKNKLRPWRANLRECYYLINVDGNVCEWVDLQDIGNDNLYKYGNYYRTHELAEQDAKELALRGRVRQLRDALCEGYQFVHNKLNYLVFYCHADGGFQVDCCTDCQSIAEIYFDTKEHAQQACDILNAELNKDTKYES